MEDCVQIDVHQIEKILIVPAGNGIHRLVRVGHGVQEGLDGGFQQLHKGLLDRVFVGTAEDGVLQNMEYAGGIDGQSLEGDGKSLVLIRPIQPAELCAGFGMDIFVKAAIQFRQRSRADGDKAVKVLFVHK